MTEHIFEKKKKDLNAGVERCSEGCGEVRLNWVTISNTELLQPIGVQLAADTKYISPKMAGSCICVRLGRFVALECNIDFGILPRSPYSKASQGAALRMRLSGCVRNRV